MSDPTFSSSWYRVENLQPQIREHTQLHRHHYRGQRWYVLQDAASGRCHRLSPTAYFLIGLMDGQRTTEEIWSAASEEWEDDAPTQDETIRLLGLLHGADVLICDVTPDTAELLRRSKRRERSEWWERLASPLSQRFALADPDAFLERWMWLVRPLFSRQAAAAIALVLVAALVQLGAHWNQVTQGALTEMLDPRNLLLLALVYPAIKTVHELAHAFATKMWGGEVHEIGLMLLVFMPVPYVDASAASTFPNKHHRMAVAASGMLAELVLAALALFVWITVEPGLVRTLAFSVMSIGGVSTILFNGNPLLRYDGYYVLADAIEAPNLSTRSKEYISFLLLRHVFGLSRVRYPVLAPGEEPWLVFYGIASFVYRIGVVFAIALFVAQKFFVVGVALALLSLALQVVLPLVRQTTQLLTSTRFAEARFRSVGICAVLASGAALVFLLAPVPLWTTAEGVVWLPDRAQVRAGREGTVTHVLVAPNSVVQRGDPLIKVSDPTIEAEVAILEARVRELSARRHAERQANLVRSQIVEDSLETARASLERARERLDEVLLRSQANGVFVLSDADDLVGRFVSQGELVAYVVAPSALTIRVLVAESDVALVRNRTEAVGVRLCSRIEQIELARIARVTPAAIHRLPSPTLSTSGGGLWPVDPSDPNELRTLTPLFEFDLTLANGAALGAIGERAYVRFEHDAEPLARRSYRALRRLFLGRFDV